MEKLSFDRNIVQFYGAVLSAPAPMLVLEFMEGMPCPNFPVAPHLCRTFIMSVTTQVMQQTCAVSVCQTYEPMSSQDTIVYARCPTATCI